MNQFSNCSVTWSVHAHVYPSCVAWSRDWSELTELREFTKRGGPTWARRGSWHWRFAKPTSWPRKWWGPTFLDLERFSRFHRSSRGHLQHLAGSYSWLSRVLGILHESFREGPNLRQQLQLVGCCKVHWDWLDWEGFGNWSQFLCFDCEHGPGWFSGNVVVPHCPNCAHPLRSTLFVPQLAGRLDIIKFTRGPEGTADWSILGIDKCKGTMGVGVGTFLLRFEGVPPAGRAYWIAIDHSTSLAEYLASTEPTRLQTVVGSVLVDWNCQLFRPHSKRVFCAAQCNPCRSEFWG